MQLAIFGSVYEDLVILVAALLLFGKRFPEVATTLGRKVYQFRRGVDDLKREIAKPLRDEIEAPLREASKLASDATDSMNEHLREAAREADRAVEASIEAADAQNAKPPVPAAAEPSPPET